MEHARRGLESFFGDCAAALEGVPGLDVTLYKGSGQRNGREKVVPTLRRDARLARALGNLTRTQAWSWEGATFALSLLAPIVRHRPDVVFFGDRSVGHILFHARRALHLDFRLVLHNGSPVGPPYPRWEHVQHTAPVYLSNALAAGEPTHKHTLLPIGSFFEDDVDAVADVKNIARLREQLGLPQERPILLCVSAINKGHKRVDYLVRELAQLAQPRPFLVVLGQEEPDTASIREEAERLLGRDGFVMRSVPFAAVASYYLCSNVFAMCSLTEGFGRTYVEATGRGLPSIAHDSDVTRYVMGEWGIFTNLERPGGLATQLRNLLENPPTLEFRRRQALAVRERYAWSSLAPAYARMLTLAAA